MQAMPTESESVLMYNRALTDPAWWVRTVLGHELWPAQIEIIESVRDNRVTAVKSCHGPGKSFIAADTALWFLYAHKPSIVITTAPTDRQVKGILWKEIRKSHKGAKIPLGGQRLLQEIKLDEDWFAWGFTAPEYDPDRFQGFHEINILVVVDEASGVSEEIYDAIEGILTTDTSRLLLIGNPTNPQGRFAEVFRTGRGKRISISAFQTPNFTTFGITEEDIAKGTWQDKITGPLPWPELTTPRWVRERWEKWKPGSALYEAKVLANFPEIGIDTLIPLHWIEAAVQRELPEGSPKLLGVDVARFGSDETVIFRRAGPVARIEKILPMSDTMETAGHVAATIRSTQAAWANIDAVGIGAGVLDRLVEQKLPANEMQSGAAARDPERFLNARAEWYWTLREAFEKGEIDIEDDEILISQLSSIRYKMTSKGQVQIESKEDLKKRNQQSPDRADALMLAFGKPRRAPIQGRRFPLGGATRR